jgi:hypothetical protein
LKINAKLRAPTATVRLLCFKNSLGPWQRTQFFPEHGETLKAEVPMHPDDDGKATLKRRSLLKGAGDHPIN